MDSNSQWKGHKIKKNKNSIELCEWEQMKNVWFAFIFSSISLSLSLCPSLSPSHLVIAHISFTYSINDVDMRFRLHSNATKNGISNEMRNIWYSDFCTHRFSMLKPLLSVFVLFSMKYLTFMQGVLHSLFSVKITFQIKHD